MQNKINELKPEQSISYIYIGVFNSYPMNIYKNRIINRKLDLTFNSKILKEIFLLRLKDFMQGEPLQRNDPEDMIMLSVMEFDNKIILVTDDNKMISYMNNDNCYSKIDNEIKHRFKVGNEIHELLLNGCDIEMRNYGQSENFTEVQ